jgi:hypothetical protein
MCYSPTLADLMRIVSTLAHTITAVHAMVALATLVLKLAALRK